jgi:putative membrane protein
LRDSRQEDLTMTRLILRWAINAVAIWAAITLVPGIEPTSPGWLPIVVLAVIFGLLNALVRPLLTFLTCPFIILTLGLGTLLINTLLFWLTGVIGTQFGYGFTVAGFWPAFLGALVVTVVSVVLTMVLRDDRRGRRPPARRRA